MKKLISFLFTYFFATSLACTQVYVRGNDIKQLSDIEYIGLYERNIVFSKKIIMIADLGNSKGELTDSTKQAIHFNSQIDAINLLYKNGWELQTSYSQIAGGNGAVFHIFRRRK